MTSHPTVVETEGEDTSCCSSINDLDETAIVADLEVLSAISSSTRYEVLRLLAASSEDLCVCQLHSALDVSQGAVSQALSRLHSTGLITRRKEGAWRYYNTTPAAEQLLETLDTVRGETGD